MPSHAVVLMTVEFGQESRTTKGCNGKQVNTAIQRQKTCPLGEIQSLYVYSYPCISELAGQNSHNGVRQTQTKTQTLSLQQFPRTLPPKKLRKILRTPAERRRDPAEPSERSCRALWETPAEPSERQISSESLAEGCAPRMVTLRNFRSLCLEKWRLGNLD